MSDSRDRKLPPPLLGFLEKDIPSGSVIPPGVGPAKCSGCGVRLLLAASSLAMVRRGEARPVCKGCVPSGPVLPVMSSEQAAELREFNRQDAERN